MDLMQIFKKLLKNKRKYKSRNKKYKSTNF